MAGLRPADVNAHAFNKTLKVVCRPDVFPRAIRGFSVKARRRRHCVAGGYTYLAIEVPQGCFAIVANAATSACADWSLADAAQPYLAEPSMPA